MNRLVPDADCSHGTRGGDQFCVLCLRAQRDAFALEAAELRSALVDCAVRLLRGMRWPDDLPAALQALLDREVP